MKQDLYEMPLPKQLESFWRETAKPITFSKMNESISVDVAIAGGGIAGITAAYLLAKEGKRVALIEARSLMSGTTGYTTSKLTAQHNLIYDELINRYGQAYAKLYYQANMEAIALIKELVEENQINCDLEEQDAFVFTQNAHNRNKFHKEAEAYEKLGIEGEFLEDLPLDIDIEAAVMMRNQAQFHPVKYLNGLLKAIVDMGGKIYEHTPLMDTEQCEQITCKTDTEHTITCDHVIYATHFPTKEPDKFYSANLEPESSYALAVSADKEFPDGMYINADSPKITLRKMQANNKNYILVGGESHPTGDGVSSGERYENLAAYAREHFAANEVVHRWSSHDLISEDRIPFVGQLHPEEPNSFVITGFGKWGLSNATIGAIVLKDLIIGNDNPYKQLFSPQREIASIESIEPETTEETNAENAKTADKLEQLQNGQGAIMEINGEKVGVYRDNQGNVHKLDLSCTHLGCDVEWNDGDCTWDCPCHGSRFNATGEVVEGPALQPLKKIMRNRE